MKSNRRSLPPIARNSDDSPRQGRAAKEKATSLLRETIAPDIALYELEKKRKGTVWGGSRAANHVDESPGKTPIKRALTAASPDAENEPSNMVHDAKRARVSTYSPPAEPRLRVAVTAFERWNEQKVSSADLVRLYIRTS